MFRVGVFAMGLIVPLFFAGAYLAFDFWNVNRMARMGDGDGVSVSEYMSGWMSLAGVGGNGGSGEATEMPSDLAMMLPKAPEGWTMRPTEPGDLDAFLPAEGSEKALREVRAAINPRGGNGVREVRMTYANGARKVVFELVRYPDFVFTSFAAAHLKMELQMNSSRFSGRGFMTVRGMEINENELPDEIGLRYLVGDVAGQIWLRALAPRTMTDQDLLPFFETLHVPAMNANVIEKVAGMGEVPVVVVASVLEEETRAIWAAERDAEAAKEAEARAAREAERAAQEEVARLAEEEEAKIKEERAKGIERDEETGVKVRKGTGKEKKPAKKIGGFGDEGCTTDGGRKVCGVGDAAEE